MSQEERALVERLARDSREARGCLIGFALAAGLGAGMGGAGLGAALSVVVPIDWRRLAVTGFVVGVLFVAYAFRNEQPWPSRRFSASDEDTEVDVIHVHAFAVSRANREETFFFDVGDEKLLVVRGTATRAAVQAGRFPNRYFTLVRVARGDVTLTIDCHGEPLTAREVSGEPGLDLGSLNDGDLVPTSSLAAGWRP